MDILDLRNDINKFQLLEVIIIKYYKDYKDLCY